MRRSRPRPKTRWRPREALPPAVRPAHFTIPNPTPGVASLQRLVASQVLLHEANNRLHIGSLRTVLVFVPASQYSIAYVPNHAPKRVSAPDCWLHVFRRKGSFDEAARMA